MKIRNKTGGSLKECVRKIVNMIKPENQSKRQTNKEIFNKKTKLIVRYREDRRVGFYCIIAL